MRFPTFPRKLAYGLAFTVLLPLLLIAWARATRNIVTAPVPDAPALGLLLALLGAALMVAGMAALWVHGHGLPMNAYPPPLLVSQGVYRILPHPIYTGCCMLCAGTAIVWRSASGLWLVSPLVMLGCTALVVGYERIDLRARFGHLNQFLRTLPEDRPTPPDIRDRLACFLYVLVPWLVLYEAFVQMGPARDALSGFLPFEHHLPVIGWTEIVYISAYVVAVLAPIFGTTKRDLRTFCTEGLLSMAVAYPAYWLFPVIAPQRPCAGDDIFSLILRLDRSLDGPGCALPSFHVIWALIAAGVFVRPNPARRWLWRAWVLAVAASCVTTGNHAIIDVLAGFVVYGAVSRREAIWRGIRGLSERIANSWREWQLPPLRLMNHGAYGGLASFAGAIVVSVLLGPGHRGALLLTSFAGLIGAGLWAQFIEGSPALLRPYGFYGGVVGVLAGSLAAPLFGTHVWLVLAAWSVAAPIVQAIGRVRCLVQGCCHGSPAPEHIGIRYLHPRSRVGRLSNLRGVPLHPTPVYSILANCGIALALTRLWSLDAPLNLIVGSYLIFSGLARFVEEGYRGEPQTPIVARLRLYQWMAAASLIAGAAVTSLPNPGYAPSLQSYRADLPAALLFGLITAFALGVDFPNSNRRFSRLV